MTSLLSARRRAEEFAAAVDGRPSEFGQRAGGADLVAVASLLREHAPVTPRPEFANDLRSRLMTEAGTALDPKTASLLLPVRKHGARERRLVAAASAVVLIGGTASLAAASQNALPGEMLYPVKRGIEQTEVRLSLSPAGKGRDLLDQANARLGEVEGLLSSEAVAGPARVPDTLTAFTTQAHEGADLLLDSFRETRDPESVRTVRTFAAESIATLESMADTVPAGAQDELAEAAVALGDIDKQASRVCPTCASGLQDLQLPGIFLARAEVDRAMQAAVPRQLDNSHPVVVDKLTVRQAQEAAERATRGDLAAGQAAGAPDAAPEASVPTAAPTPDSLLPDGWPRADRRPAPDSPDLTEAPGGVVEDLTDDLTEGLNGGLNGVVETLLPESGEQPKLLP